MAQADIGLESGDDQHAYHFGVGRRGGKMKILLKVLAAVAKHGNT
jgi:hypothetical protein